MSTLKVRTWNIEEMTGYKPITTFYEDFSIADRFGKSAVKDTYKNGMMYAKTDYKVLTEFVMALNWKIWEHYKTNIAYATLYDDLFSRASAYAVKTLKGDEMLYYYRTTD